MERGSIRSIGLASYLIYSKCNRYHFIKDDDNKISVIFDGDFDRINNCIDAYNNAKNGQFELMVNLHRYNGTLKNLKTDMWNYKNNNVDNV